MTNTEMLDRAVAYCEAGADAVWIGLLTTQDYVKAVSMIRKPLMTTIAGANMPTIAAAMKAARISVGKVRNMVNIALGAIDKALADDQIRRARDVRGTPEDEPRLTTCKDVAHWCGSKMRGNARILESPRHGDSLSATERSDQHR